VVHGVGDVNGRGHRPLHSGLGEAGDLAFPVGGAAPRNRGVTVGAGDAAAGKERAEREEEEGGEVTVF